MKTKVGGWARTLGLLLLLVCPGIASAQITSSTIAGRVTAGETGVTGATVSVVHEPTGARTGAVTNADGRFFIPNLKSGGPYVVSVAFIGYKSEAQEAVYLTLGNTTTVNFALTEQAVALEGITVSTERNASSGAQRTGPSTNVGREQLAVLPSLSRSLQDFTRLTPQGNANSFGGTNFRYNNITIDGAANNDAFGFSASPGGISGVGPSGTPGSQARTQPISLDAIQEVQVVLAPFDVRMGNFTGGSVNAVTRGGTNQLAGSIYSFGRNQTTTGRSADDARTRLPAYSDYMAGARLGGPLVKDRAFFFLNVDAARRSEPVPYAPGDPGTAVSTALAQQIRDTLQSRFDYDPGALAAYDMNTRSNKVFGRLDFNLGDAHKLNVRHNYVGAQAGNLERGAYLMKYGGQDYTFHSTTHSTVAELKSTLPQGLANSLILGYSTVRDHRTFPGQVFPQLEINGPTGSLIYVGTDREAAVYKMNQNTFELTNNLTLYRNRHTWTAGLHSELYGIDYYFLNAWNGRWQYSSVANFMADKPSRIRGTYSLADNAYAAVNGTPSADFRVWMPSVYLQDEIALTDRLRITPGLRVDIPVFPDKIPVNPMITGTPGWENYTNELGGTAYWAPRLSFVWDARGDESLTVRGGTGIFSGRIPFAWIAYGYYNTGLAYGNVDLRPSGAGAVVPLVTDPSQLQNLQSGVFEANLIDNNFKMAQVSRSSAAIDYRLPGGVVATLEGMYTKTLNDVKFVNIGLRDSTTTSPIDGRPIYLGSSDQLRVNKNFTSVFLLTNTHEGHRYSITGQLQKSFASGISGMAAYTYAQAKDISNGIRNSPQSNWEFNQSEAPNNPGLAFSNFDLRHRLVGELSWRHRFHERLMTAVTAVYSGASGSPFSYVYIGDHNRDGSSSNDPIYVPRDLADARIVAAAGDTRTAAQIWEQFDDFIRSQPLLDAQRGQIAGRNSARTPWNHQIDLRILQDVAMVGGGQPHTVQLTVDVINAGALLGSKFGRQYFVPNSQNSNFPLVSVTQRDAQGVPTGYSFDPVPNNTPWQYDALNSRYQAQVGLRYSF